MERDALAIMGLIESGFAPQAAEEAVRAALMGRGEVTFEELVAGGQRALEAETLRRLRSETKAGRELTRRERAEQIAAERKARAERAAAERLVLEAEGVPVADLSDDEVIALADEEDEKALEAARDNSIDENIKAAFGAEEGK